ncbi:MAG: glycoside hydrolase family 3 protein [Bacteroidales bacterium]|nr:glycoside hydrolase family 3 protein [Bacteroidales bacterium]
MFEGAAEAGTQAETPVMPETVVAEAADLVAGAAGSTYAIPRLGIPSIVLADGPAGLRISSAREGDNNTYYCTAFPVSTLIASSWDVELAYQIGQAMGNEVLEYGADVLLAPALNIHRNPLCGRNFEYYSEDPLVSGKMAAAVVNGVESQGVGTSIKHYAANNAETNRMSLNTIASERALREIYLEGYRIAVQEAQPWTVMSSYNLINGTYASESPDLLTTVLRNEWGFEGFVMTDWGGGSDPVAQMVAGNDLLMPGNMEQAQAIIAAVQEGTLDEAILDRNVEKILKMILNSPKFRGYEYSDNPDLDAHAELARQAATDGMVLLQNENAALPFDNGIKNIAAFGNASYDIITGGTGSGDVNEAYSVSLTEGLENGGYTVNPDLQKSYTAYIEQERASQPRGRGFGGMFGGGPAIPEMQLDAAAINRIAASADVALITIGRNSGEGRDRSNSEGDFLLSQAEKDMVNRVTGAFHAQGKKAIVILNVGGVIETASWRDIPDAILLAWQGGQEAGNSIADVLSGRANPSGKLATTFPMKYEDNPSSETFPGIVTDAEDAQAAARTGGFGFGFGGMRDSEVVYDDGIYVGYRYYETFGILTAYEFGYGLSYTGFTYDNLTVSSGSFKDRITVTVDITNSGNVGGKEVVQLYISAPDFRLEKPDQELKGFAKTRLLQPGESQTVTFEITARSLASFNTAESAWIAEYGTYEIRIGSSCLDIRQYAAFDLEEDILVETVNKALTPVRNFMELSVR